MYLSFIQTANLVLVGLGLIAWVILAVSVRRQWLYTIAPISWLMHAGIYYIVVGVVPGADWMHDWSAVLRLQGIILLVGAAVILIRRRAAHADIHHR